MQVTIDKNAGFCSGVIRTIRMAENELTKTGSLYCLGQIVHNEEEEKRLKAMGLKVIGYNDLKNLHNARVLIRTHGEPPETYLTAEKNNLQLIEGTCPVVLRLQHKIKKAGEQQESNHNQVVIYGKKNHPEVVGLNGQIKNKALLIEGLNDIEKIDLSLPVSIFAQTTKSAEVYNKIINEISERKSKFHPNDDLQFTSVNSICAQVSNRNESLRNFAGYNDVVIFVGGENSSNGKYLFSVCKAVNNESYYIGSPEMLKTQWFENIEKVGVSGATSTPQWLLESVAAAIEKISHQ